MTLPTGTRLGAYEIIGPLGAGGMGEVYRARDSRLERTVALKVLPDEFFEDKERVARFGREAKLLAALNHPGIAAIYSFEEIPGSPGSPGSSGRHLLVMELLEGETLRESLAGGPLPARRTLDVAVQMARGLAAAHEKGVVHRDLKPENVFLTKEGRVKLLDFGLAKLAPALRAGESGSEAGTLSRMTKAGVILGTVSYMSPEQVRGESVDHRSDIFSFGTIVYEMISGQNPFRRETSPETMTAILKEEPSPFAETPSLSLIAARCLEKRKERRFQSTEDLAFALETLSTGHPSGGLAPRTSSSLARRQSRMTVDCLVCRCRPSRDRSLASHEAGRSASTDELRASDVPSRRRVVGAFRAGRQHGRLWSRVGRQTGRTVRDACWKYRVAIPRIRPRKHSRGLAGGGDGDCAPPPLPHHLQSSGYPLACVPRRRCGARPSRGGQRGGLESGREGACRCAQCQWKVPARAASREDHP